jgi:hypothetical protein
MPEDIPPARNVNKLLGIGLLLLSAIPLLPIYGTLRYDGIGHVFNWPAMFYGMLAVGVLMMGTALNLLFRPQHVGAEVFFRPGGFDVEVRAFFLRTRSHRVAWEDVEKVVLVEAPRGGDLLAFRLTYEAAIREGLIRPSTRPDAPKALVRREVRLPVKLTGVSIQTALSRFESSVTQSGFRLVRDFSLNLLVYVRKVWRVEPA